MPTPRVSVPQMTVSRPLGEGLHETAVLGQHPGVVHPDAGLHQLLQGLAEPRAEPEGADGILDGGLAGARHACDAGQRLGLFHGRRLGERHDVDRAPVVAQRRADRLVHGGEDPGELERHGPLRAGDGHRLASAAPGEVLFEERRLPERRRHEQVLGVGHEQQRHLPRPAAVGLGDEVELVHDDQADVGELAVAQGVVGQHLGGRADDRGTRWRPPTPRSAPSSPVVANRAPSGLKATSFTSISWPGKASTVSPVSASRMSTRPDSSGPSVTKTEPSGLQSTAPPMSGTLITRRCSATARCKASTASGNTSSSPAAPTAARPRRTLRSGSSVRLASDAAASSRIVATRRSRSAWPRWSNATTPPTSATTRATPITTSWTRRRRLARTWRAAASADAGLLLLAAPPGWRRRTPAPRHQVTGVGLGDVEGHLEPGAAVERARVTVELDPAGRRLAEVAECEQGLPVLVDPVAAGGATPAAGPRGRPRRSAPGSGDAGPDPGGGPRPTLRSRCPRRDRRVPRPARPGPPAGGSARRRRPPRPGARTDAGPRSARRRPEIGTGPRPAPRWRRRPPQLRGRRPA